MTTAITPTLRASVGQRLLTHWQRLSPLPGGSWMFSRLLGAIIPYTGSIGSQVTFLEPGHARVQLSDRRKVRNHLNSVHAIALANLAELSTGLAVLSGMPAGYNGILIGLEVRYLKKARGRLVAECHAELPSFIERQEVPVVTRISDAAGDIVTEATARWLIGPMP